MTKFDDIVRAGTGLIGDKDISKRVTCADNFTFLVSANEYSYATPQKDCGPYTKVEVGYLAEKPEPWSSEWSKYTDEATYSAQSVYGYVPISIVQDLINFHGGEK